MKNILPIGIALLTAGLLSNCSYNGRELVTVRDKPMMEDHLRHNNGNTYRIQRYVVNEQPLETIKVITLVDN